MPHRAQPSSTSASPTLRRAQRSRRPMRVLLLDADPACAALLRDDADRWPRLQLVHAESLEQARTHLAAGPVDLALIDMTLREGGAAAFAHELRKHRPRTQVIALADKPSVEVAMEAMRTSAVDLLPKPVTQAALQAAMERAVTRQQRDRFQHDRVRRLRQACRKLSEARTEIAQQVDVLCNDLIQAYQELAEQMQQAAASQEYAVAVHGELDLGQLLQKTLIYLLEKLGPANAVVFVPASDEGYSVGGYANYDDLGGSPDILLDHLADVLAPRVAETAGVVYAHDDATLSHWLGDDAAYLADSELLAFRAQWEDEPLAVVALWRDAGEPFDAALAELCYSVGQAMAEALVKLIRVHHRQVNLLDEEM